MWILPRNTDIYRGCRRPHGRRTRWTTVSRMALWLWPGKAFCSVTEARVATNQAKQEQCKSPSSHACMLATCACILLVCLHAITRDCKDCEGKKCYWKHGLCIREECDSSYVVVEHCSMLSENLSKEIAASPPPVLTTNLCVYALGEWMCLCEVGGILLGNLRSTYAPHLKVADFSQTDNIHAIHQWFSANNIGLLA